jgi:hypothetical protein
MVWTGLNCLRIGTVEGSYEHGDEPSASIKCQVIELLHKWRLLKKVSNSWSLLVMLKSRAPKSAVLQLPQKAIP